MTNVHKIKQDICDIGRRIYNKGFAAANDGNITVRIGKNEVLCTPTMHSKGFLKPDDICTVDMTGKQTAGRKKRSSEALLHLEIYRQRDDIKPVVTQFADGVDKLFDVDWLLYEGVAAQIVAAQDVCFLL